MAILGLRRTPTAASGYGDGAFRGSPHPPSPPARRRRGRSPSRRRSTAPAKVLAAAAAGQRCVRARKEHNGRGPGRRCLGSLPDQFGFRLKRWFDVTAKLERLAIAQATILMSIDCQPHVPRSEATAMSPRARGRSTHRICRTSDFFAHMVNCLLIAGPTDR